MALTNAKGLDPVRPIIFCPLVAQVVGTRSAYAVISARNTISRAPWNTLSAITLEADQVILTVVVVIAIAGALAQWKG